MVAFRFPAILSNAVTSREALFSTMRMHFACFALYRDCILAKVLFLLARWRDEPQSLHDLKDVVFVSVQSELAIAISVNHYRPRKLNNQFCIGVRPLLFGRPNQAGLLSLDFH